MKYLVLWSRESERSLESMWGAAPDRERVFNAAYELEGRLRKDPRSEGESREDFDRRITFEPPLGAYFRIVEPDTVIVSLVWDTERNKR